MPKTNLFSPVHPKVPIINSLPGKCKNLSKQTQQFILDQH